VLKRALTHLPQSDWPVEDLKRLGAAFETGDIFDDDRPAGAHLSAATRRHVEFCYARWLRFLAVHEPEALELAAERRITQPRVQAYVLNMAPLRMTTVASELDGLGMAARSIAPSTDWAWLKGIKSRVAAQARPLNRLPHLQPPWALFKLGVSLMDDACASGAVSDPKQYRDGLIIALLALWPIRRRSLTALTVDRHVRKRGGQIALHLHPEDTKGKRAESFAVPSNLQPYFERYLNTVRPGLLGTRDCAALWISTLGNPLNGDAIYKSVRRRTMNAFGQPMGLHDFRRSAATFLAVEEPEKIGLIPQILSHANREVSDRHYNLAGSGVASRRFLDVVRSKR
jgi:integrase/recombinase XerD